MLALEPFLIRSSAFGMDKRTKVDVASTILITSHLRLDFHSFRQSTFHISDLNVLRKSDGAKDKVKSRSLLLLFFLWGVVSARAAVRVYVEDHSGLARIKYECTGGEVVRSFALDVTVDQGQIVDISDFFRGESTTNAHGYGIFPASFRDHITVSTVTNVDWEVADYTPLAVVGDAPGDTLPGLGTSGVTLEFGALWDARVAGAGPGSSGTLCALAISEPAEVSITNNAVRGGVVSAVADETIVPEFSSAVVDPTIAITGIGETNGVLTISFTGGELESAPGINGPWTGTGNDTGVFVEALDPNGMKFFRVRAP